MPLHAEVDLLIYFSFFTATETLWGKREERPEPLDPVLRKRMVLNAPVKRRRKDAPISPNTMASSMQDLFGSDEEDVDDVKAPRFEAPQVPCLRQPL